MYRIEYAYNAVYKWDESSKTFWFYKKLDQISDDELDEIKQDLEDE
jgi:hypothetical protein